VRKAFLLRVPFSVSLSILVNQPFMGLRFLGQLLKLKHPMDVILFQKKPSVMVGKVPKWTNLYQIIPIII